MEKVQISIRLPINILEAVDKMAEKETRNRNNMIEVLLMEAIKNKEKMAKK